MKYLINWIAEYEAAKNDVLKTLNKKDPEVIRNALQNFSSVPKSEFVLEDAEKVEKVAKKQQEALQARDRVKIFNILD